MRQGSVRVLWVGALGMLLLTCGGAAVSSRAADWHPVWLVATLAILGVLVGVGILRRSRLSRHGAPPLDTRVMRARSAGAGSG